MGMLQDNNGLSQPNSGAICGPQSGVLLETHKGMPTAILGRVQTLSIGARLLPIGRGRQTTIGDQAASGAMALPGSSSTTTMSATTTTWPAREIPGLTEPIVPGVQAEFGPMVSLGKQLTTECCQSPHLTSWLRVGIALLTIPISGNKSARSLQTVLATG